MNLSQRRECLKREEDRKESGLRKSKIKLEIIFLAKNRRKLDIPMEDKTLLSLQREHGRYCVICYKLFCNPLMTMNNIINQCPLLVSIIFS